MTIFDRGYRNFEGELTPVWSRFTVSARYGLQDAFSSRLFLLFFLFCFLWPLACAVLIYLRYNSEALAILDLSLRDLFTIDAVSFRDYFMIPQSSFAFGIVLLLAPSLVAPDFRNNALPLYLARPLSKLDYVAGKFTVLAVVLSAITWVPGWLLFLLQSYLEGAGWWRTNLRALSGMFVGFWIWILALSLLGLAVSALVKWKPMARILFLGSVGIFAGMGQAFNQIYGTWKGSLLDLNALRNAAYDQLFGLTSEGVPGWAAWSGLLAVCLFSGWLLSRRIRAYEVFR